MKETKRIMSFTRERMLRESYIARVTQSGRTDLDSHADTCVMGKTYYIYENTAQQCTVYPYSTSYKPKTVTVAHGGTAYDHPDGQTYILDVNNGFNMTTELNTSLLNPNQMRAHGIVVDEVPTHLSPNYNSTHSIYIPEQDLRIPLELDGVISYLPTRMPTMKEINDCTHITLTSTIAWDPYSEDFGNQEAIVQKKQRGNVSTVQSENQGNEAETDMVLQQISYAFSPLAFTSLIPSTVGSMQSKSRQMSLPAEELAKKWGIGVTVAERTLLATTQQFI
jgi:hypothetical protein